jgi:hypothetical protein
MPSERSDEFDISLVEVNHEMSEFEIYSAVQFYLDNPKLRIGKNHIPLPDNPLTCLLKPTKMSYS